MSIRIQCLLENNVRVALILEQDKIEFRRPKYDVVKKGNSDFSEKGGVVLFWGWEALP